ncbi:hypothetical protein [Paenibacillus sp. GYB003]|uniref:hypothetical protein n=1 Tax=Paenibacillus sp. GYB003 TaxID=2994392 RepID=UPI002F961F5B
MIHNISLINIHAGFVVEALKHGEDAVRFELNKLLKHKYLELHFSFNEDGEKNETYRFLVSPELQSAGLGDISIEYIRTACVHVINYWVGHCLMYNAVLDQKTNEYSVSA